MDGEFVSLYVCVSVGHKVHYRMEMTSESKQNPEIAKFSGSWYINTSEYRGKGDATLSFTRNLTDR